jgi:hypothetical protein
VAAFGRWAGMRQLDPLDPDGAEWHQTLAGMAAEVSKHKPLMTFLKAQYYNREPLNVDMLDD